MSGAGASRTVPRAGTIVFLVNVFPRLSETFVLHEFLELRRQGLRLRLVAVRDPGEPVCHEEAAQLREEVTYLRGAGARARIVAAGHALRHYRAGLVWALLWVAREHDRHAVRALGDALGLVRLCDDEGLRHVHAHFAAASTAAAYLAYRIAGLPYSFTAHARDIYTTPTRALADRVGAARAVVTCTEANRVYLQDVIGVAPGRVRVLRHGIPLRPFLDVHRVPVPGRVLTVARLAPKKGHELIAQAFARLVADGRDVQWHVAGEGLESGTLERLVTELGVRDRVRFLGGITAEQVRAELAAAQVFVVAPRMLPNGDRDGIPNVLFESMAAGVPVVTSAVSGIPEVVRDGETGLLVAPDDPSALATALARLLDDAALADHLAVEGRRWAVDHCDLERSVAPLAAVMRALTPRFPANP